MESNLTNEPHLIRLFEEAEEASLNARKAAERDRDYRDLKQLTSEEQAELRRRGQPIVVSSRIQQKVDFILGLEKQQRKDPKAFPRTPGDEGSAQAATDALRYVCDDCDWDARRSEAMDNLYVEGTGAIMVGAKPTREGMDPDLIWIPWDRLFWDPCSRKQDFADAGYMGIITWYDLDEAKAKYPHAAAILEKTWDDCKSERTYDDRPKFRMWADYKRKRVRVVEGFYRVDGQWMTCTATKAGEIIPTMPSPYLDADGKPENPIKAASLYIDRDNNRYGAVRGMISPTDEQNKRRSKALHLITMRQSRVSRGAGMEPEDVRRELAKPDGVVVGEKDEFEILGTGDMAAGNMALLQEAKSEIDRQGPNVAMSGKTEADLSGRAITALQQGGMVEAGMVFDRLRILSMAVYRSIWARIRQTWTGERWVRVTDDERNIRFVGFNRPVTYMEFAQQRLEGDPEADLKLGLFAADPRANTVAFIENPVGELDVDITIDEGIDTPTVAAEQFDILAKIIPAMVGLPPKWFEVLLMSSSLRDKDKLLEKLAEPPPAEEVQRQQITDQVQLEREGSKIEETKSRTAKNFAVADREGAKAAQALAEARAAVRPPLSALLQQLGA